MGIDIFTSGNNSLERLIQSIIQFESQPRFDITDKQSAAKRKTAVLTDLDSKLSKLNSLSERLTDQFTDHFNSKAASTSDKSLFTASATSTALIGNHDILIQRLAASDTRVSKQFDATATDLRSFFDTNGAQTIQLDLAHPTDADSSNRVSISVAVNSSGATNDDIMTDIATAINDAMAAAVTANTIDADEKVVASVVHEESGKSRIVFKSQQTGFTYRMGMTDSSASLLTTLDINSNVLSAGTAGGYITNVGTSATDSELNSKLQLDGLTFYRDSNAIGDILNGVTITLKDITPSMETLTVSNDSAAVQKEVEDYLSAYNDVLSFVRAKIAVDPTTNTRGVLADDSTYRSMQSSLRGIMTGIVDSAGSGNPDSLFEIGITADSEGKLSITDSEKFKNKLSEGSTKISDIFNSSSGIAERTKTFLDAFVKVGGILDNSKDVLSDKIKNLDARLARFDDRMAKRELQLREQFAQMQKISQALSQQSAAFNSVSSAFG